MRFEQPLLQAIRLTPLPVPASDLKVDLSGIWDFHPAPQKYFYKSETTSNEWNTIEVPSEWSMKGFEVKPDAAAGYRRDFILPDAWRGKRIKLKCDGIYSDAKIWINAQDAGNHLGGFTAFELDVTSLVHPGKNTIAISVQSASLADKLASGTQYATHDLGGITRKIYLFAVPELNVADLYVRTDFDKDYRDAKLIAQVAVANESAKRIGNAVLTLTLRDDSREIRTAMVKLAVLEPGALVTQEVTLEVTSPSKWDAEHPHLYDFACTLTADATAVETVDRRVGFRQIEVRGHQLYINNHPVKLRGVNHHEVDPLRGRSLVGNIWRKDVELFQGMNCNLIRTCHYPPAEELLHACDELGMFVEVEAPFCWAPDNSAPEALDYTIQAEIETVLRDRSHPSVIMWSVGNESAPWGKNFEIAHRDYLRQLDTTRPYLFEISSATELNLNPPLIDIDVLHYPGLPGTTLATGNPRPVFFGEFSHLNVYNRSENLTDPGLRDVWGRGVAEMWERMLACENCLGGAIWAGIDDLFVMPQGGAVGYGEWGPVDGWRRPRPEYWHLKKIFSPIRIQNTSMDAQSIRLTVENRQLFSDLNEVLFEWSRGAEHGEAKAAGAPGSVTTLVIPIKENSGKTLELKAFSSQGFLLDVWRFPMETPKPPVVQKHISKVNFSQSQGKIRVAAGNSSYEIDATTGIITDSSCEGEKIRLVGPSLMVLPMKKEKDSKVTIGGPQNRYLPDGLRQEEDKKIIPLVIAPFNPSCSEWLADKVSVQEVNDVVEIHVTGKYKEAEGTFTLQFSGDGKLHIAYDFKVKEEIQPRQMGLVFALPVEFDTLKWHRNAQWPCYPEDHIGRPEGEAHAFPTTPNFEHRTTPEWGWSQDCSSGGSNDFRSTKMNIITASLTNQHGKGLLTVSDGEHHVRAWMDRDTAQFLIADFNNEGAANFFNEYVLPHPTLKPGDAVKGSVSIELLSH